MRGYGHKLTILSLVSTIKRFKNRDYGKIKMETKKYPYANKINEWFKGQNSCAIVEVLEG